MPFRRLATKLLPAVTGLLSGQVVVASIGRRRNGGSSCRLLLPLLLPRFPSDHSDPKEGGREVCVCVWGENCVVLPLTTGFQVWPGCCHRPAGRELPPLPPPAIDGRSFKSHFLPVPCLPSPPNSATWPPGYGSAAL